MAMGIAASASSCYNVAPCRSAFLRFPVDQRELLSIGSSNSTTRRRARRGAGVMPVLSASPSDAMQVALQSMPDPNPDFVTWQVVVGAAAGVIPFVVAGIEFSKRIASQRKCKVCKGSGLVKRDEYYFRCYQCGGFLPWQSWQRFFSGE